MLPFGADCFSSVPGMPGERCSAIVDRLDPRDAATFVECVVLDALAFPQASAHFGLRGMGTWIARATDARRVLGFLAVEFADSAVHIRGLAVQPDARRRGVGRVLLRAALQDARSTGKRVALLEAAVGNRAAVALYASEGFAIRRRMAGYYAAPVFGGPDAYQMILQLEPGKLYPDSASPRFHTRTKRPPSSTTRAGLALAAVGAPAASSDCAEVTPSGCGTGCSDCASTCATARPRPGRP